MFPELTRNEYGLILLFSLLYRTYGTPVKVTFSPKMLGISGKGVKNYQVIDVFDGTDLGIISIKESIKILVNPTGNQQPKRILVEGKWGYQNTSTW